MTASSYTCAGGIAGITFMFYMHGMVLDGWWLDSRDGVTTVEWTVPVLTAVVTVIMRSYLAPVALWMGLFTGMGIILWLNGLGNIWPCARRSETRPVGRSESRPPAGRSFYGF